MNIQTDEFFMVFFADFINHFNFQAGFTRAIVGWIFFGRPRLAVRMC